MLSTFFVKTLIYCYNIAPVQTATLFTPAKTVYINRYAERFQKRFDKTNRDYENAHVSGGNSCAMLVWQLMAVTQTPCAKLHSSTSEKNLAKTFKTGVEQTGRICHGGHQIRRLRGSFIRSSAEEFLPVNRFNVPKLSRSCLAHIVLLVLHSPPPPARVISALSSSYLLRRSGSFPSFYTSLTRITPQCSFTGCG